MAIPIYRVLPYPVIARYVCIYYTSSESTETSLSAMVITGIERVSISFNALSLAMDQQIESHLQPTHTRFTPTSTAL